MRSRIRTGFLAACLSLLALAPSAQGASVPTFATGTNTFDNHGGTIVLGYVNPDGSEITSCRFLYGLDESYGAEAPCEPAPAQIGDEVQRLLVAAGGGQFKLSFESQSTPDLPYDASAAQIQSALEALSTIGSGNVSVAAGTGRYFTVTFEGALAHTDLPELGAADGTTPLSGEGSFHLQVERVAHGGLEHPAEVDVDLGGLQPGATYHFAVEATNAAGTAQSEDAPFAAAASDEAACPNAGLPGVGFLPDCRAWELVSPAQKHGGEVLDFAERIRLADDGSAATFSSLQGFAGAIGSGAGFDYLSQRSPAPGPGGQGWSTHAITPAEPSMTIEGNLIGGDTHYVQDFSPDLDRGVVQSFGPLTADFGVGAIRPNLYLRDDLRSPGPGSYSLLTACPLCVETDAPLASLGSEKSKLVGATPDLGRALFESHYNLVAGATGTATKLYESDGATVRLVGVSPGGTAFPESAAGNGVAVKLSYVSHAISADGSKVFFSDKATDAGAGNLYMRLDGAETVQLNLPEGVSSTAAPAHYWDASTDGSRVFFTSTQRLTEDAPETGDTKLYMYDTTKPPADPHNLTYLSADNEPSDLPSNVVLGVLGASADGSTVYFLDAGQLQAGAPPPPSGGHPLLAWHEGVVRFVAFLDLDGEDKATDDSSTALGKKWTRVTPAGDLIYISTRAVGPGRYDQGIGVPACALTFGYACREVLTYDPATQQLECASCDPSGQPATASAEILTQGERGGTVPDARLNRPLSADGSRAFFSTADSLVPEDTNGVSDAYAYDTATGAVHLLSSGTSPEPSYFVEASPSGHDALFVTGEPLVGWDTDQSVDLYDARVGGGFPEPPPLPEACQGESCRSAAPVPPPAATPASTSAGPGNPPPLRRCPRGRHRVVHHGQVRCLKPRHHHRRAHANRGARR